VTGDQALVWGSERLTAAGLADVRIDARILLARALGCERSRLTLYLRNAVAPDQLALFKAMIARRENRVPVSHIIGTREFYGRQFQVNGDVLDPRPETETLIEAALAHDFSRVLDLGTGSGCILLTLLAERPLASGLGGDISGAALDVARRNAQDMDVATRADFFCSDWFDNIGGTFDLIVANPPYISQYEMEDLQPEVRLWEPLLALSPGGDGLASYRLIAARIGDFLTPNGVALFEIGHMQARTVSDIFRAAGFDNLGVLQDLGGQDRVVLVNQNANDR
jgi:release factor glutamine methyltransferase